MIGNYPIMLGLSLYLTQSYRLGSAFISDTFLQVLSSLILFTVSIFWMPRFNFDYLRLIAPIGAVFIFAFMIDEFLMRGGRFTLIFLAKMISICIVGCVAYNLRRTEIIITCFITSIIVFVYLIIFKMKPYIIILIGSQLSIEDPLIIYGNTDVRVYYLYFQANIAAYSITFIVAACILSMRDSDHNLLKIINGFTCVALFSLAALTLSRGSIVALFLLGLILVLRNKILGALLVVLSLGIVLIYVEEIIFALTYFYEMRGNSMVARGLAMQEYFLDITTNPLFGMGYNELREAVSAGFRKPSHNQFLELLAAFGWFIGGGLVYLIARIFLITPTTTFDKKVGGVILVTFAFSNNQLLIVSLFGFLIPILNSVLLRRDDISFKQSCLKADSRASGVSRPDVCPGAMSH